MQPDTIAGADSSFFLQTGTPGTPRHLEIDIECINAGRTLHTNACRSRWCSRGCPPADWRVGPDLCPLI